MKPSKCQFMMIKEVEYLSPNLREGTPTDQREDSNSQGCSNTQKHFQVKSSLGLLELLHQVLPNMSTKMAPSIPPFPRRRFFGTGKQNRGRLFSRPRNLCPHTLVLTCNASTHGVGAVLSHKTADGQDQLIAYASHSFPPAEQKYAHIEKEALTTVFGVK